MMQFLLIGASFSNKGAEAMATTAIAELRERYADCRITVASYAASDTLPHGRHTLSFSGKHGRTLDFELIGNPRLRKGAIISAAYWLAFPFPRLFRLLKKNEPMQTYLSRLREADVVLDISGFALSDQRSFRRRLIYCLEILTSRCWGKSFIVFTQALGPFHLLASRLLAALALPHVQLLLARGQMTFAHLRQFRLEKNIPVYVCADMAYLLPPSSQEVAARILGEPSSQPYFGIIPNIRAFQQCESPGQPNPYLSLLIELCNYVRTAWNCRLALICHEQSAKAQNDQWLIEQIRHQADSSEEIVVVSAEHSSSDLKAVIGCLDFVVASRFHAVVGAISMATPFVVIGWAHKYHELLADIGMENMVFDAAHLNHDAFFDLLRKQWEQRAETKAYLARTHEKLKNSASRAFDLLHDTVGEINGGINHASARKL